MAEIDLDALRKEFADYITETEPSIRAKTPGLKQIEVLVVVAISLFGAAKELKARVAELERDITFQKSVTDAARQQQAELLGRAESAESRLGVHATTTSCMCSGLGPCEQRTDGSCRLAKTVEASAGGEAVAFQNRVRPWMLECFGSEIASDRIERNHRFFEEATELVQACGMTASEAHQLVDYTFGRPVGQRHQEVGGVMVTLAALCLANELNMHYAGEAELARISVPATVEKIRAKQAAKPKHSPLPEHTTTASAASTARAARAEGMEEAAKICDTLQSASKVGAYRGAYGHAAEWIRTVAKTADVVEKLEPVPVATVIVADFARCAAHPDGDCTHAKCPQLRDGEPEKSGRHCPLDTRGDDE
ncbi:hypothetical protein [Trinickia mobilis]|uniref:hypothetical protein n=1 Tax=Trinickia mobilis TaxID=2816356 RepID=UPI001F5C316F|nr:hypothetical protein [Trinickia mobilis]